MTNPTLIREPDCSTCGQPVHRIVDCRCGHPGLVHDIRRDGSRGRCNASAGLDGCTCARYEARAGPTGRTKSL